MFRLFKKLFSTKDGAHTVVILNDDGSKPSQSYRLSPFNLWLFSIGILLATVCIIVFFIIFTPIGGFIYNQENMRESVISIQQRVAGLQDTLEARNRQLQQIKDVLVSGKDTTFATSTSSQFLSPNRVNTQADAVSPSTPPATAKPLPNDALLISHLFQRSPAFPAPYPVDGTPTRLFNRLNGHFGIDIAVKSGSPFHAIADGVIINQEWTLNYGYVITIQHSVGIVTIYKHAESIDKNIGESVLMGDILGRVGDVGILSSGPHLHIEIWERGIPQDPQNYLINS